MTTEERLTKKDIRNNKNVIRHDVYTLLKILSSRMHEAGITDKELLLQKSSYLREKDLKN